MATELSRRAALALGAGAVAAQALPAWTGAFAAVPERDIRVIPATGARVPAIGMGTWITFNVGEDLALRRKRAEILKVFFRMGGGMIDSSPMYGSSEDVVGWCLAHLKEEGIDTSGLFSATKVWTPFLERAEGQMAVSEELWGLNAFDLQQVHNLVDREEHLDTLFAAKEAGRIRHVGVTTSHGRRHAELERVMRSRPLDFVQLTYNILDREAENRLLPLAREKGIAVIANRPFRQKALIRRVDPHPLPGWANEIDCANWPQVLLKYIVSHPAVTCAIPATAQVDHMRENMGALTGPLPDAALRRRMADHVAGL